MHVQITPMDVYVYILYYTTCVCLPALPPTSLLIYCPHTLPPNSQPSNVAPCRSAQDSSDLSQLPVPAECAGPPQATAESTPR